jgi:hypothetical protein
MKTLMNRVKEKILYKFCFIDDNEDTVSEYTDSYPIVSPVDNTNQPTIYIQLIPNAQIFVNVLISRLAINRIY